MRRLLLIVSMFSLVASQADAQIMRRRTFASQPSIWVSGGSSLQQAFTVHDGGSASVWEFGDAVPYVASLEKELTAGASVGVRGSRGRTPLVYSTPGSTVEADATVSQLMAVVHVASGGSFHSVFELGAGATVFSEFRGRTSATALRASDKPDTDFTFLFGYGAGYSFSPRFAVEVVQDLATALHQKTGLSAGESTSNRIHSTRFVARLGLGTR